MGRRYAGASRTVRFRYVNLNLHELSCVRRQRDGQRFPSRGLTRHRVRRSQRVNVRSIGQTGGTVGDRGYNNNVALSPIKLASLLRGDPQRNYDVWVSISPQARALKSLQTNVRMARAPRLVAGWSRSLVGSRTGKERSTESRRVAKAGRKSIQANGAGITFKSGRRTT
jgi:hypothetical protein